MDYGQRIKKINLILREKNKIILIEENGEYFLIKIRGLNIKTGETNNKTYINAGINKNKLKEFLTGFELGLTA